MEQERRHLIRDEESDEDIGLLETHIDIPVQDTNTLIDEEEDLVDQQVLEYVQALSQQEADIGSSAGAETSTSGPPRQSDDFPVIGTVELDLNEQNSRRIQFAQSWR